MDLSSKLYKSIGEQGRQSFPQYANPLEAVLANSYQSSHA